MSVIDKRYKKHTQGAYVSWDKTKGKWLARVRIGQSVHHIGRFNTESTAETRNRKFLQRAMENEG
jgi:hypothetical protein